MFLKIGFQVIVSIFIGLFSFEAIASSLQVQSGTGVKKVTLTTNYGDVELYLPSDITPNEHFSFQMAQKPKGKNQQRKENAEKLKENFHFFFTDKALPQDLTGKSYFKAIALCGDPVPDVDVTIEQIPPSIPTETNDNLTEIGTIKDAQAICSNDSSQPHSSEDFQVFITDKSQKNILHKFTHKLYSKPLFNRAPSPFLPSSFPHDLPVPIFGPFDGDIQGSTVTVNEEEGDILYETQRTVGVGGNLKKIVKGVATYKLAYDGFEGEEESNRFDIEIKFKRGIFSAGKSVKVEVIVSGLKGIRDPFVFDFINATPQIGHLQGGDEVHFVITPDQVDREGQFTYKTKFKFTVTGQAKLKTRHDVAMNTIRNMK